ncbi:MAG: PhnD/SsuA/transferrin family substrate-binding protein [Pseudomonadota bacterium]
MWASLPMYDRPELVEAHDRFWAFMRDGLREAGVSAPDVLERGERAFVWDDPAMLLSQTCGMPFRVGLHRRVSLIGTPDYGVEGCPPGFYQSVLVVRAGNKQSLAQLLEDGAIAFNMRYSQSGFAALHGHAATLGYAIDPQVETGAHHASAKTVAEGGADLAALDAVSWRFMQRYDDFASELMVLDSTKPTPGLPLVTAFPDHVPVLQTAYTSALQSLSDVDREALGIGGLVAIPHDIYMAEAGPHG